MSNRIDFYQPDLSKLALPAATVSVSIDGSICPELQPLEIVRSGSPEFSWARLLYNPAANPQAEPKTVEQLNQELAIGKVICINQIYNESHPGASIGAIPIFIGQIEAVDSDFGAKGLRVEVTAKDFHAVCQRITIYGQRVRDTDGSTIYLAGSDTFFNKDAKPNAAATAITHKGKSYTAFCADPSNGVFWTYAQAIDYLLKEHLPQGQLQTPVLEQLQTLTDNQTARDLDVTGLNLLEALQRCCERTNLRFKFFPTFSNTQTIQAIIFYKNDNTRTVELACQQSGEQLSISKTNIAALHERKNFWPITHKYIGQGDFKIFEATFDLVKAWDPADESTDYETFSPSTNPAFYQVKNVYRKWCLNEAGDYSESPYNQGQAFDFSKIFDTSDFVHRRRRFWPALTTDKQDKSLSYYLQVSFDNGSNWWQYLYAFNVLLDECGIWLSSDWLDIDTWIAALKGVLKFRITASVINDERLTSIIADGPVDSTVPVINKIIQLPRQFKYRKVTSQSIFVNSTDQSLGTPDEVDDTTSLYEFVRKKASANYATVATVKVQTPYLAFDYQVGDNVTTATDSRDLLGIKNDSRNTCHIERIHMDFENQCTNLKIIKQRN